jgi:hypothetical protein
VWKGDNHHTEINLHRQYGPLVRIGPRHISVSDPKAIPIIYGINKGFTKVNQISTNFRSELNLTFPDGILSHPIHFVEQGAPDEPLLHPRRAIPPRPKASHC